MEDDEAKVTQQEERQEDVKSRRGSREEKRKMRL